MSTVERQVCVLRVRTLPEIQTVPRAGFPGYWLGGRSETSFRFRFNDVWQVRSGGGHKIDREGTAWKRAYADRSGLQHYPEFIRIQGENFKLPHFVFQESVMTRGYGVPAAR